MILVVASLLTASLTNNITIGVREGKYDESTPIHFEEFVNLNFSINALYVPFQFKHTDHEYMKEALPIILSRGRMPLLIWDMSNSKELNSVYESITDGNQDAYLNSFADAVLGSLVKDAVVYVALGNDINTEDSYWRKNPELYMQTADYVAKKLRNRTKLARAARATDYYPTYEFVLPMAVNYKLLPSSFVPNTTAYNYSLVTVSNFGEPEWSDASDLMTKVDSMLQQSEDVLNTKVFIIARTVSDNDTAKKADWISDLVDATVKRCLHIPVLILDNVETGKDTGYFMSVNGDKVVGQNSNGEDLFSYCRLPDILARDEIHSWIPEEVDPPVDPPVEPSDCEAGEQLTDDGVCEPCPAGTASETGLACTPCAPGTYQPSSGSSTCFRCSAGQYQTNSGKTSCLPCPVGSYQGLQGAETCTLCPYGQYQPGQGQVACIRCPGETTTNVTGATSRESCVCAGTVEFNETSGRCEICPTGQYKPLLSNICTDCPVPDCKCDNGGTFNTLTGQCENNTSSSFTRTSAAITLATIGAICVVAAIYN
ncbi:CEGP1 protein [Giardia lamblia P15]|uniref:CEGP1 protein n=1 Tax=Giardia intestinalis (strain P15) TaxID=658858 RepID=E1F994_GIAIA|nr:CEGP1 protein [Giardia lamblia P15]